MRHAADVVLVLGFAALCGGVAMVYVPAAVMVLGLALLTVGSRMAQVESRRGAVGGGK